jgi:hypothetical protein
LEILGICVFFVYLEGVIAKIDEPWPVTCYMRITYPGWVPGPLLKVGISFVSPGISF